MAVLEGELERKDTELTVVFSEDPAVSVPAGGSAGVPDLRKCGWVPADQCTLRRGATQVQIRALSPGEWAKYKDIRDAEGRGSAYLYACRTGVVKVNSAKRASESRAWVDRLSMVTNTEKSPHAADAFDLLALRVIGLTRAIPVESTYEAGRVILGLEAELAGGDEEGEADGEAKAEDGRAGDEEGPDGATKSGGD